MRISVRFSLLVAVTLPLSVGLAAPLTIFAGGGPTNASPASPKPDTQERVWTNDDVERLNPSFVENSERNTSAGSVLVVPARDARSARPAPASVATSVSLDPQQDPRWYAQQLVPLEEALAELDSREQQLRQFRATGSALPTGLVLDAPCEGITTDNLIEQLEFLRQDIAQQVDALGDLARQNNIPAGVVANPNSYAAAAIQPSADAQRAALNQQVQEASEQLAEVRGVVAGMGDQLSAQGITMLRPTPGYGGNMTTDLLDRLDNRASALQNEISNAQDAARELNIPPSNLR